MKKAEADMKEAAIDVSHEIRQLFLAAKLWPIPQEDRGKRLIMDAYILHCCNAIDFLFGDEQDGSISASHFFDDAKHWQPTRPAWFADYRVRRNKLLAHLTYTRAKYRENKKMGWEFDEHLAVRRAWEQFLVSLPADRKAWFNA